jgi:hypothetical protein
VVNNVADTLSQSKMKSDGWLLSYNKRSVMAAKNDVKNREICFFWAGALEKNHLQQSA